MTVWGSILLASGGKWPHTPLLETVWKVANWPSVFYLAPTGTTGLSQQSLCQSDTPLLSPGVHLFSGLWKSNPRGGDQHEQENLKPALHAVQNAEDAAEEHFICKDGMRYAGMHLIIDLWGGKHLDNLALVKQTLTEAVSEIGATLLNIDLHHFEPNGGISGVAVLAESHMSIHTWPEKGYAALDVFVCGDCQPQKAIPVLRRAFLPDNIQCTELKRGLVL
jgi:S-adenosylmethionine decarboxylase